MRKSSAFCALFLLGTLAIADHLPPQLQARGKPENTLAKINLDHGDPVEVLQSLGPPTRKVTVPNNPQWTGYLWDTPNLRIEVEVSRSKKKDYLDQVTIVRLGSGPGAPSSNSSLNSARESTGRELKLGDTIETLKSRYGSRFQLSKQAPVPATTEPFGSVPGIETAVVQWTPDEFTLTAGFDAQGRIIAMRLSPPECYPGGCQ